jgi:hypothetical protein
MTDTRDTADFIAIAHRIIWCTLATVDARGRPRSRVVHPTWEMTDDGPLARVCTRATPTKRPCAQCLRLVFLLGSGP